MDITKLVEPRYVIVNGSKRRYIYGDWAIPEVKIQEYEYLRGELGLMHPGLINKFNERFFGDKTKLDNKTVNNFNSHMIRRMYRGSDDLGFTGYTPDKSEIPIVLFDPTTANMNPVDFGLFEEERIINPGYLIAPLRSEEFMIIMPDELDKTIQPKKLGEKYTWLGVFGHLMRRGFERVPIEVTKREISREEFQIEKESIERKYTDYINGGRELSEIADMPVGGNRSRY